MILTPFNDMLWSCYSIALLESSVKSLKGVSFDQFEKMTSNALGFPVGITSSVFSLSCDKKDQEVCAIIYLHTESRNCTEDFKI